MVTAEVGHAAVSAVVHPAWEVVGVDLVAEVAAVEEVAVAAEVDGDSRYK